jgi:hypothetical protein
VKGRLCGIEPSAEVGWDIDRQGLPLLVRAPHCDAPSEIARAQRLKAKVITIDLDQVEGPHEDALVIPSVSDAIER